MNNMEIKKPNDILIATLSNPEATPYDLLSRNITGENTSLLSKDDYKKSNYIQETFKDENGKFNDIAFNQAYDLAQNNFYNLTNQEYLENLNKVEYSPFDITRPKLAKTFDVSAKMIREENPFEIRKGWAGIGSEIESPLSLRELAQREKVYDPTTDTWSDKTLNELGLLDKLFGDTYVYAQYDEDTVDINPLTGQSVTHKKGDWKFNENGKLYVEKLAGREIYGKQVVNSMDILTTDGSIINQFDFLDSDGREKSIPGTVFKLAAEIAPVFIPGVGTYYGGVRAAVGLASALPTFYKAVEGLLLGDEETSLTKSATALEGWMSKYTASSVSDEASDSMFGFEQMSSMVSDIFTQIYEQRAMASLSKMVMNGDKLMNSKATELANKINTDLIQNAIAGKIKIDEIPELAKAAMEKIPELKSVIAKQSQLSKALSLGYMALTSTSDIYGEALNSGYDRRTAGFAALASAAGQYTVMMNNGMGDWFLDQTTGYSKEVNKAMMRKAVLLYLDEIAAIFNTYSKNPEAAKKALGISFKKIRNNISDIFTTPSVLGEAMWKNAMIEGVEEVTEQAVLDATKGMIDTMSYLGMTGKKGSFGGWENVFSAKGAQTYLANLVGGVIGGGLFEFQNSKIEPWLNPKMVSPTTIKSLSELIASGHRDEIIDIINKERKKLGNKYITLLNQDGSFKQVDDSAISQSDVIADRTIDMVNLVDGILNSHNLIQSDEEIINKTIRDRITINRMKSAAPDKSNIGLEGLVLEDYKSNMVKIVELESKIKSLEANPENLATAVKGNPNVVDNLKTELKVYVNEVNDILEGKNASEYFGQVDFLLNKKLNSAYINIDRASYANRKYGVDYNSLSESGSDTELSKKRIDTEWEDYVNSKDLKKDLKVAYKVYKELEKILNPSIAEFVESGYSEEYKKTISLVKDLDSTITLFNTSESNEDKQNILKRFTEINNELEKLKITSVPAWTVYHNDVFEQLDNLGLIVPISNVDPESFDKEKEDRKEKLTNFFKRFPMNPFNVESIINQFNKTAEFLNVDTLNKIETLENKEDKTEEDINRIKSLKDSLINFKIDSYENTPLIVDLKKSAEDQIASILENNNIDQEKWNEYLEKVEQIESTDKETLNSLDFSNFENWTKEELKTNIDKVIYLNLFDESVKKLASSNASEEINKSIEKLNNDNFSDEDLKTIKSELEPFIGAVSNTVENLKNFINNKIYEETKSKVYSVRIILNKDIEKLKPEILKLNNHAFDLILNGLESGINDKELYSEAKVMFDEELLKILNSIFPDLNSIRNKSSIEIMSVLENLFKNGTVNKVLENIEDNRLRAEEYDDTAYGLDTNINSILSNEEDALNIFNDVDTIKFISDNFNPLTTLGNLNSKLRNASKNYNLIKNQIEKLNRFIEISKRQSDLKSNPILDFIRNFSLTLNSNPNSKVNKILDILASEENLLKSSSAITNYMVDDIRESDLDQASDMINMLLSVINAMSTTTVDFDTPVGFIQARQDFAKKYKQEDEVLNLKTITSDMAELMSLDLKNIQTKLQFLKELGRYNSGKLTIEQNIIEDRVELILLDNWKQWSTKINPSFLPNDRIKDILSSDDSNTKKLSKIENLVFDLNVDNKEKALKEFLKGMSKIDSDEVVPIDREVKYLSSWDIAIYIATVLSTRNEDVNIRNLKTIQGNFSKAPFFTQKFAARVIKASTINPTLFSKILEINKNSEKVTCDFITFITGGAGVGKTSAVFGLYLDDLKQTNDNLAIWLSAPESIQLKNLENGIVNSVGTDKLTLNPLAKSELFERLGLTKIIDGVNKDLENIHDINVEKQYVTLVNSRLAITDKLRNLEWLNEISDKLKSLPNILMIDEVTHYSAVELFLLNEISRKSYEDESLSFMKIVAAGDPTQMGKMVKISSEYYNYNIDSVTGIFAPRLWSSLRVLNSQKKVSFEILSRISSKIVDIYKKELDQYGGNGYQSALEKSKAYLDATKDLNTLPYYEDDNIIAGERIVKSLDISIVNKLKKIVDKDPNTVIGILTESGTIPEDWNTLLTDAGLITPDGTGNIKIFTTKNIQGSEVDYFIFDVNLTTKFDKLRDNFRAFYTYASRSKKASIIVDSDNVLRDIYKIVQGNKASYLNNYEPLNTATIKSVKEKAIVDLLNLVGANAKPSKYDNFVWETKDPDLQVIEGARFVLPLKNDKTTTKELTEEEKTYKEKVEKESLNTEEFKVMFHSFYNNPNAKIKDNSIEVDPNNGAFDLNFPENVDSENFDKVYREWLTLKSFLIMDKPNSITSTKFIEYLKRAFVELNSDTTEKIDVEYVITVSNFNKSINSPVSKEGFDDASVLKDGDLFINLSAKLKFGGKIHYITLASLGTKEKIAEQAKLRNYDLSDLEKKFSEFENKLKSTSSKFLELKIDKAKIDFSTNTRLVQITDKDDNRIKYDLTILREKFPNLKFSEIKFYPNNKEDFEKLESKYVFNKSYKEVLSEEKWEKHYNRLKGQPYIVISYADDLNGDSNSTTIQARLVQIGSDRRDLKTLIKESESIVEQMKEEAYSKNGISDELNAKKEVLLNRSDILEVLIVWATTPYENGTLLDLLRKEIGFTFPDDPEPKKTSVFNIFNRFGQIKVGQSGEDGQQAQFINVIEKIEKIVKAGGYDNKITPENKIKLKEEILKEIKSIGKWHWTFYNIFAYNKIINNTTDESFLKMFAKGLINSENDVEAFYKSDGTKEMKSILKKLLDAVENRKFYYSVPIKYKDGSYIANPLIGGKNGFKKELYSDKFYIDAAPEMPRVLMGIDTLLNATYDEQTESEEDKESYEEYAKNKINEYVDKNYLQDVEKLILGLKSDSDYLDLLNYFLNSISPDPEIPISLDYINGLNDALNKTVSALVLEKSSNKTNRLINDIRSILRLVVGTRTNLINFGKNGSNGVTEQNSSDLLNDIIEMIELSGTEDGKILRDLLSRVIKKDMSKELYDNLITVVKYDRESAKSNKDKILTLLQQIGIKSFNDSKLIREEIGIALDIETKGDRNIAYKKINDLLKQCK